MPLNGFITNYTKSIIVHSDYSKEKLLKKNIGRSVQVIRSYANIEESVDSVQLKEKYGYDKNDIIIASFGHIHETKRTIPALKAFCRLTQKYKNIIYLFTGKLDSAIEKNFNSYVRENNLADKVKVTGYIALNTFIDYIGVADICVNLRYPYNGETSGSLMRILAKGKCVIVNDIGSFSEIPDECGFKIPNARTLTEQEEIDCIYQALEKLVNDSELRETLSKAAQKYAEDNLNIEIIAKQYRDVIMDKYTPALNEEIIQSIINHEVLNKNYSKDEIMRLSETLAYTFSACYPQGAFS
jgi:glycosyltransferase involved in cell wall biosynthesis